MLQLGIVLSTYRFLRSSRKQGAIQRWPLNRNRSTEIVCFSFHLSKFNNFTRSSLWIANVSSTGRFSCFSETLMIWSLISVRILMFFLNWLFSSQSVLVSSLKSNPDVGRDDWELWDRFELKYVFGEEEPADTYGANVWPLFVEPADKEKLIESWFRIRQRGTEKTSQLREDNHQNKN